MMAVVAWLRVAEVEAGEKPLSNPLYYFFSVMKMVNDPGLYN